MKDSSRKAEGYRLPRSAEDSLKNERELRRISEEERGSQGTWESSDDYIPPHEPNETEGGGTANRSRSCK
ncbi:MAG: hypothetical protein ACI4XL_10580 [Bacillus sp. (in: firmicutes)]